MDEIFIEEKKYISSKRAAKITGYAKDYVGQLCREGRVQARLVGRNWYVLETAIQDHRFGDLEVETKKTEVVGQYREENPEEVSSGEALNSASQNIQDSWQMWFDRFEHREKAENVTQKQDPEPELKPEPQPEQEQKLEIEEDVPVNIPIHNISRVIPSELLPRYFEIQSPDNNKKEEEEQLERYEERKLPGNSAWLIKASATLVAIIVAMVAAAGTGYFDQYILSSSQARMVVGVVLYNSR